MTLGRARNGVFCALLVALVTAQGGCIDVEFRSSTRAQDVRAGREVRRLIALESAYHSRTGRYALAFSELDPNRTFAVERRFGLNWGGSRS